MTKKVEVEVVSTSTGASTLTYPVTALGDRLEPIAYDHGGPLTGPSEASFTAAVETDIVAAEGTADPTS